MGINVEGGKSVYCKQPIQDRENHFLYATVREWVEKYCQQGTVLDLGCSDLPASQILVEKGYDVVGVDLDNTCLKKALARKPTAHLVQADLTKRLPFTTNRDGEAFADTVLLLDVLEHLRKDEAKQLLGEVQQLATCIIVSMPIISATSIPCIKEFGSVIKNRKRPTKGLFDRTHITHAGRKGHKKLFNEANLKVVEEQTVIWCPELPLDSRRFKVYSGLLQKVLPTLIQQFNGKERQEIVRDLVAYQGLYVLTPEQKVLNTS